MSMCLARPWFTGFFVILMHDFTDEDAKSLFAAVAKMFVQAAAGIDRIVAERTADNSAGFSLPLVLPHQLINMNVSSFNQLMRGHEPRLLVRLSEVQFHRIGQQLSQLRRAYAREEILRQTLDSFQDETISFEDGWKPVGDSYNLLRQLCGDLASTFPNTATVESEFSVLGWEKDAYRKRMTDFALEGVMHAKQFQSLQELVEKLKV